MTDEYKTGPEAQDMQTAPEPPAPEQPPQAPPAPEPAPALGSEAEEGKVFAILSYALNFVGLPFFLIPLIMRNNSFSLYHAKQCLILWILGIAGSVVSGILMAVCIGVVLAVVVWGFCLVLNIIGLMNAVKLQERPLPLIGKYGEEWFRGITKTA
jgi:uncharacterized membrane protein